MRIMRKAKKLYIYILAHFIIWKHYDKKYIRGKYFFGQHGGIGAQGWKWVVDDYYGCKRLSKNINVKWPVSPQVTVVKPQNIEFSPDDLNNFQTFGTYFQAIGKIIIGKGTWIAPNVGLITANHSIANLNEHADPKDIVLGKDCWIGMNSVILPGVTLGNHTVVGAGSVVTKSFPEGNCVIAGNPAKIIRIIDREGS
ncbi:MAG: acyltransferase [Christensenellaceae bacterium]